MQAHRARRIAQELQLSGSSNHQLAHFHGKTMLPFLREGDQMAVAPVAWEDIRVGDILTYRFLERYPTRRVTQIRRDELVLKGDSISGLPEFVVAREDVLGRAEARLRDGVWCRRSDWAWRRATYSALARLWVLQRLANFRWIVRVWLTSRS